MEDRDPNSVSSEGTGTSFLAAPRVWLLFAAVMAVLLATDQVSKFLAVRHLAGEPDVKVVGDLLQLNLVYNPGAAFSLGTRFTLALTVLACAATVVVLWVSRRAQSRVWAVGLGFLLAGITGNLSDRLFRDPEPLRGHVVDFLMLPNWPIFNVADICINIGVGLILIQILRGVALDGSRTTAEADEAEMEAEADAEADPAHQVEDEG